METNSLPSVITLSTVKDLATVAKPLVDPLIAALISPKLKQLGEFLTKKGLDKKIKAESIEQKFHEYLMGAYERFCTMNILVFPNQQILIQDIYQPLSLVNTKTHKAIKINSFKREYIEKFQRLLIADSAGMGKSTLTKRIGASIIEQKLSVPVLIELKRLSDKHKIINEIADRLGNIFGDFDKELIIYFVNEGQFTFLLDGFDEIRYEFREPVIDDIKAFIRKSRNNWFILTSRPDSALTAFGDFQVFHINPLTPEESYQLILKYDSVNTTKVGPQLIADIKDKLGQVKEFLVNPFLVSLLYRTYTYNKDIPSKKTTFYDEIYGALYKHHDLSKDGFRRNKLSGLDFEDFRTVVNHLAFNTAKAGEVEYSQRELIQALDIVGQKCVGITFKSSSFAEDIEHSVPLFSRDGSILKWAHKSLQDFFAASYISASVKKREMIEAIYKSQKSNYLNIIDFLIDMEPKLVRDIIVYEIITCFIKFCNSTYKNIKNVSNESILRRQELAFDISDVFLFLEDENAFGAARELLITKNASFKRNRTLFSYRFEDTRLNNSLHCVDSSYRHEIMALLHAKSYPIFKPIRRHSSQIKHEDAHKFLINALGAKPDEVFILNDKISNPLNKELVFDKFTNSLVHDRSAGAKNNIGVVLDYDKCIKLIEVIEESMKIDAQGDELSGF